MSSLFSSPQRCPVWSWLVANRIPQWITMWGPTVISWFISPSNYFVLSTINHSYWSCVHQLSYRGRGPRMIIIITKTLADAACYFWFQASIGNRIYWSHPPNVKHPNCMVPMMWKFPPKPWLLRGCLILEGRIYTVITPYQPSQGVGLV